MACRKARARGYRYSAGWRNTDDGEGVNVGKVF